MPLVEFTLALYKGIVKYLISVPQGFFLLKYTSPPSPKAGLPLLLTGSLCQAAKTFFPLDSSGPGTSELSSKDLPRLSINASPYQHSISQPATFSQISISQSNLPDCVSERFEAVPGQGSFTCFTCSKGYRSKFKAATPMLRSWVSRMLQMNSPD